ncbi:hypothetical protein [Homoserinimonas sp. OAct 916]|uniref:hypothetical protein n=1 Tax=Homoserinimonas sp. OAct 916 TaxID=2211450 RepID=UPI000DBE3FC2|nr:hypothetical protein [Homoserinimonas sp. OAct 916]
MFALSFLSPRVFRARFRVQREAPAAVVALIVVALIAFGMMLAGVFVGTPAFATDGAATGACGNETGVTVVVDFTDLGGDIEIGCATEAPESGRSALTAAGFTSADSQPGFLCSINSMPDPCPTTFEGSFWSYWHSAPNGEWTSYQVGADTSTPVPGELEGWRYSDGTVGPRIEPAAVVVTEQVEPSAEPSAVAAPGPVTTSPSVATQSSTLVIITAGFAAIVAALAVWFIVRARRRSAGAGNDGD